MDRKVWKDTHKVTSPHRKERQDPNMLLKTLLDWIKPKSNVLAAAVACRLLEQGNLSLAKYIDKATVLCDQCEYPPEARDRMLKDAIVIGLRSRDAYYKYIEKGSSLSLNEAIEIAQSADATASQIQHDKEPRIQHDTEPNRRS